MASDLENKAKEAFIDGYFQLAADLYSQAIDLNPNSADLFADRGQANIKLGNLTEAVSDANKAIELDASMAKAYLRKGIACMKLEEYQTAKAALDTGISLASGESRSRFASLIKECEDRIAEETGQLPMAVDLRDKAMSAYFDLDYQSAVELLSEAINAQPHWAELFVDRAIVKMAIGDYGAVIEDADEALKIDPRMMKASILKGIGLMKTDEYARAVSMFEKPAGAQISDSLETKLKSLKAEALNCLKGEPEYEMYESTFDDFMVKMEAFKRVWTELEQARVDQISAFQRMQVVGANGQTDLDRTPSRRVGMLKEQILHLDEEYALFFGEPLKEELRLMKDIEASLWNDFKIFSRRVGYLKMKQLRLFDHISERKIQGFQ